MNVDIRYVKNELNRITLGFAKKDILAVGIFGSLARGDFDERSDIDIFVITEKEMPLREQHELYYGFSQLIPRFGRDISVLVYDLKGLKTIPTWQTLNLAKDAHFVYDRAGIEKIFDMILRKAEDHGIVYDDREKVFKLKAPCISNKIRQFAKKAGLDSFHTHTLRHKFATDLLEKGANVKVVQELLGHENLATTEVYLSIVNQSLHDAVDLLDQ